MHKTSTFSTFSDNLIWCKQTLGRFWGPYWNDHVNKWILGCDSYWIAWHHIPKRVVLTETSMVITGSQCCKCVPQYSCAVVAVLLHYFVQVTPWSRVRLKLRVALLAKNFPAFCGNWKFITVFTREKDNILVKEPFQVIQKNPTKCNGVSIFIIPCLREAQHVSGVTPLSSNHTSNNLPRMQNQRLLMQF